MGDRDQDRADLFDGGLRRLRGDGRGLAVNSDRTIVTGAAGFIGSHLVEALLAEGRPVLGIDCFSPYYDPAIKRANIAAAAANPNFELVPADLNDLTLDQHLNPGDTVFHLAAQAGVGASWGSGFVEYSRANIEATQRLLEAAFRRKVRRVVFASSSSVYGDAPTPMEEAGPLCPISPYGVTKLTAEQLCLAYWQAYGLEVVPLRFFSVYGPRQRPDMAFNKFIAAVTAGRALPMYGEGKQRRDFTYVGDVVRILMSAVERGTPGLPVNVGGGSAVSVLETIELVERYVGKRAIVERRPHPPGDARDTLASTVRLSSLATPPLVPIHEGLARQVEWQLGARRSLVPKPAPKETVVLYSHDTYGLGHLRRNLAIAHAVHKRSPETRIVMLTGSPVAEEMRGALPVRMVKLPPVVKVGSEEYAPAGERSFSAVRGERAGLIASTLLQLRPSAFLVDHAPEGMKGELRLALHLLREHLPETRVILGLRDILDDGDTVRESWARLGIHELLEHFYDEVLVYGSRELFDVVDAYGLSPGLRARTTFTGYVAKDPEMEPWQPLPPAWACARRRLLVIGGGGGDAAAMLHAFLEIWPDLQERVKAHALLVTGPLMSPADRDALSTRVASTPQVSLEAWSTSMLRMIGAADAVLSMGGYNSVVEALAARKPLVIVPRTAPRHEQLLRARMLRRVGLARVVPLGSGPRARLAGAVEAALLEPAPPAEAWASLDLEGARRTAGRLLEAAYEAVQFA
jgi:predicted glycosyltransferase/nucleoside-diphosphate-sugar epimerase